MLQRYDEPAVVVGLNPTALGVVRSLAPHCSTIIGIESNREEPGIKTRLARVRLVENLSDHQALLRELVSIAHECGTRPVLFLTSDEHVTWAAANRARLEEHYRTILPSQAICETLMFKDRFLELAARENLPVPRTAFVPTEQLVAHIASEGLQYPVIIKPTNKAGAWEQVGLDKAYIVRDAAGAADVASRAQGVVPSVLVQEYLEGEDGQIHFCLYFSAPGLGESFTFCGRKIWQWPPLRGSTAACEPVDDPALAAFTRDLFDRLGVEGFASLEVKNERGGGFKIIEPTIGRVDLQSSVATLNGMNLPLVAYLTALGRPEEARAFGRRTRSDVAWVYEASIWSLLRAHAVDGPALLELARRPKGFALASWSDPAVLGAFAGDILERATRRARALVTF